MILDCDPGVDDAIAILLALASPEIELVGITCVAGNKGLALTARNALRVCAIAVRPDVPVYAGSPRSLLDRYRSKWPSVHGDDGLCDLDLPGEPGTLQSMHAVDFIIEQVLASPGAISLCATGPMTNIALAILKVPEIVGHIRSIVFMGGAAFVPGNSTPRAEFNFVVDPEAAQIVLSAGIPLVMFGLDVTSKVRIREEHVTALERAGSPPALAAAAMLRAYGSNDPCLHDPCAVLHFIAPALFTSIEARVDVLLDPPAARGSVVAAVTPRHRDGREANCSVTTDCKVDAVLRTVVDRLAGTSDSKSDWMGGRHVADHGPRA